MVTKEAVQAWAGQDLDTMGASPVADIRINEQDNHRHIEGDRVYDTTEAAPVLHDSRTIATYKDQHQTLFRTEQGSYFLYERTYCRPTPSGRLAQAAKVGAAALLFAAVIGFVASALTLMGGIAYTEIFVEGLDARLAMHDPIERVALYAGLFVGVGTGVLVGGVVGQKTERMMNKGVADRAIQPFETPLAALACLVKNDITDGVQRLLSEEGIEVNEVQDWVLFEQEGQYVLSQPDRQYAEVFAGDDELKEHLSENEHTQLYEDLYANELKPA